MDTEKNIVHPFKVGHSNIYFIKTKSGYALVDTGMSDTKLVAVFKEAGVKPKSISLVIATHGHLDHIKSLAYAKKMTGAKILCHRSISENLITGKAESPVPQNLVGRILNLLTGSSPKIEAVTPDILIDDEYNLSDHDIPGKIIHTPGHSPSSISIILDTGEALIGDLVRGKDPGSINLGMFYDDRKSLIESLKKVAVYEPRLIYLSHGNYIDNSVLTDVIQTHEHKS